MNRFTFLLFLCTFLFIFGSATEGVEVVTPTPTPSPGDASLVQAYRTLFYLDLEKATDLFGIRTLAGFKRFLLNQSILFRIASEGAYSQQRRNERAHDKIQVDNAFKLLDASIEPADEGEIVDISEKTLNEKIEYTKTLRSLLLNRPTFKMYSSRYRIEILDLWRLDEDLKNARDKIFIN